MNLKLPLKYSLDVKIIAVALLYYFAARLGYFFAFENTTALPTWPPSGIAFALIILLGRQTWPGITIGSLVANVMAYWNNPELPPQTIIIISSLIAVCNTLEAVVGNYLVKHWIKSDYPFRSTKNAYRFLFVSLFMCCIGACLGSAGLYINGVINASDMLRTSFSWWVGNVVGILLFTPFILACAEKMVLKISTKKFMEIGIFFADADWNLFALASRIFSAHVSSRIAFPCLALLIVAGIPLRLDHSHRRHSGNLINFYLPHGSRKRPL